MQERVVKRTADMPRTLQWFWSFWFEPLEIDNSVAAQFGEGRPLKKTYKDGRRATAKSGGTSGRFGG